MREIITFLLTYIQLQAYIIKCLCVLLLGKNYKPKPEEPVNKKYQKLSVDPLPNIGQLPVTKIYDYRQLMSDYKSKHGKELRPVKRRGKNIPPADLTCPYCGAPHAYIYDNNGGKGQYACKVCLGTFFPFKPSKDTVIHCPFCHSALSKIKQRKDFDIYKCTAKHCSYYKKNLKAMTPEQKKLFSKEPHRVKIHYIYRKFHFDYLFLRLILCFQRWIYLLSYAHIMSWGLFLPTTSTMACRHAKPPL